MPRHYAIVPAAGSGSRFGAEKPKQYLELLGRPLIFHALAALTACPAIERVWVVLAPDDPWWPQYDWSALGSKLETVRCGGATRAESVTNGLRAASMVAADDDWILVHDAARAGERAHHLEPVHPGHPQVGHQQVRRIAADGEQRVAATEPRDGLWQAQTPQMFRYGQLEKALKNENSVTDEAGAIEALGLKPKLVRADSTNLKVTYPADLALAAMILRARK